MRAGPLPRATGRTLRPPAILSAARWPACPHRPLVPAIAPPPKTFSNNNNSAANYATGRVAGNPPAGTGTVESQRVLDHSIASPFFTGPLRSPDRLQNTFANESFMDEVAAPMTAHPGQYRLRPLNELRLIAVLNAAANAANWETRPSP